MATLPLLTVIVIAIFRGPAVSAQFMCYACEYNDNASRAGYTCVTAPHNITETENQVLCDLYKICHTIKVTSAFNGEIMKLTRGCGERVPGCEDDGYDMTCTSVCSDTSLCNDENEAPPTTISVPGSSTTTKDPNAQLECYSCQYDADVADSPVECVTAPQNITSLPNTIRCPAQGQSCYILATRSREGDQHVTSMVRACRETETVEDFCSPLVGTSDETCLLQCEQDLCNSKPGTTDGAAALLASWTCLLASLYLSWV